MPTIIDGTTGVDKVQPGVVTSASIPNGELPIAKLATTGTASNTTFLRGDGSWQAISTTPTTADVLAATAGASYGAVGTYGLFYSVTSTNRNPGSTVAGSGLYAAAAVTFNTSFSPAGTWRVMGFMANSATTGERTSVCLRIS